jgi:hypothetical protein
MDMLGRGMIHAVGRMDLHCTQNSMKFKVYELFYKVCNEISGSFHLIVSD